VARWRQNFDAFFNTIDDLLFVLDEGGGMIHVNETVCRRLGYREAELLGRPVLDVHPPLRRDEAGRIVAAMLAGEAAFCPVPVVTKDGVEIPVETRVVPGVWDGEPALFGVTKDVSALKVSEEKFDRLFRHNPALMAVSSLPERRYTDVNDAFLSALGYSREEVLGCTAAELDLFVDAQQQRTWAEQLEALGRVSDCELKIMCKDGTILDGLFSGEVIESQGRQYFLTVMVDQTARKQAEQALRESEERHKEMIASISDVIAILDPDGTIRYMSPTIEKYFGWRPAELVGSDGYAEPWLDEGPTTYAQLRDLKALGDCDFSRPFAGYGTARLTWTLGQFSRHDDWYDAVYGGAACALAKLDRDWGKGAVDGILRRWVERYRGGIATTADFIALLRERAPAGYDVDGFLRYARLTP
jgi:PAS domain S-box-containing protein